MKRFLCNILLITAFSFTSSAHTMRELLRTVPDSLTVLLTRNNFLDFPDYIDNQMKAEVRNRLGGTSEMLQLTDDYTLIQLSKVSTLQMKLLPQSKSKIILCVFSYFLNDSIADSQPRFYDLNWKPLPVEKYISLKREPDTMLQLSAQPQSTDLLLQTYHFFEIKPLESAVSTGNTHAPQSAILHWKGKKFK